MRRFEKCTTATENTRLPQRSTEQAAGYDYGDREQHISVGDKIAQGIFLKFGITADDATAAKGERHGGIGSTGE